MINQTNVNGEKRFLCKMKRGLAIEEQQQDMIK